MMRPSWMIFVGAGVFLMLAVIGLFASGAIGVKIELLPPEVR
jgi:hypothetical protein